MEGDRANALKERGNRKGRGEEGEGKGKGKGGGIERRGRGRGREEKGPGNNRRGTEREWRGMFCRDPKTSEENKPPRSKPLRSILTFIQYVYNFLVFGNKFQLFCSLKNIFQLFSITKKHPHCCFNIPATLVLDTIK